MDQGDRFKRDAGSPALSPLRDEGAVAYAKAMALSFAEVLWPTRCAICDAPGEVLCERCKGELAFVDYWKSCPRCGAPWGMYQCTECNALVLQEAGYVRVPYRGLACAVHFDDRSARVVRVYKDAGERRLAADIAYFIASAIPPGWLEGAAITFVPATRKAHRRRGFDHAEEIARHTAGLLKAPLVQLLLPPDAHDQRALSRKERFANLGAAVRARRAVHLAPPQRVIVVDDVVTTGATISAASRALLDAGVGCVYGAAFARVC